MPTMPTLTVVNDLQTMTYDSRPTKMLHTATTMISRWRWWGDDDGADDAHSDDDGDDNNDNDDNDKDDDDDDDDNVGGERG